MGMRRLKDLVLPVLLFAGGCAAMAVRGNGAHRVISLGLLALLLTATGILYRLLPFRLPAAVRAGGYLLIFLSLVAGEWLELYMLCDGWDIFLHFGSGALFAAFAFCLLRHRCTGEDLLISCLFCTGFSVLICVLWEFFEWGADLFLHTDMQKDVLVGALYSVRLPHAFREIADVTVNGERLEGYLDVGLFDTMKDLLVGTLGAVYGWALSLRKSRPG